MHSISLPESIMQSHQLMTHDLTDCLTDLLSDGRFDWLAD